MPAKTFWKTISVIKTSSAEVSSQAMRPLSWTTPSLSINSSRRNTRRMPRRSSVMTMKRLCPICFSKSCTLVCSFTLRSKAFKYGPSFRLPCSGLSASFWSRSAMPAMAAFISSDAMFISPTGSSSGKPAAWKRLCFLMVANVFSKVLRPSSDFGSPSGMFDRILLIFVTSSSAMGRTWPSAFSPEGGAGFILSTEPGSHGKNTSTTHMRSSPSPPSSCSGLFRREAATKMPHPQSSSPSLR
mmetsp:Transcript_106651/g.306835  ORF Transcript_106651/g.306835 Transcript_106651/m.306835 type:complete len:242 (-) Transcript_106651:2023-2748(-)